MAVRRIRDEQAGFGLIEVLVSIAVLALGVLPAVHLLARGQQTAASAQHLQVASSLATQAIEELRARPFDALRQGALRDAAPPADAEVPDRIGEGSYAFTDADGAQVTEPLAPFTADASAPPDAERVTLELADGRRTFDVWRVVSLRTESCPVLELGPLLALIDRLQQRIATLVATSGDGNLLHQLVGSDGAGGRLAAVAAETRAAQAKLTPTVLSLLGSTLATKTQQALQTSLSAVDGTVSLQDQVAALRTALLAVRTQAAAFRDGLTGAGGTLVDLCQLPDDTVLPDVRALTAIDAALDPLTAQLTTLLSGATSLEEKVQALSDSLDDVVLGLLGTLLDTISLQDDAVVAAAGPVTLTGSLGVQTSDGKAVTAVSVATTTTVPMTDLATLQAQRLTALLQALTAGRPHNTVRISVGVRLVGANADVGPRNVVWVSTIVTDPTAGVL